jgi:hypothetical protein
MTKKRKLICDKTEILGVAYHKAEVRGMPKKKLTRFSLIYDQIKSICVEECVERKLFKKIPSERILIYDRKDPDPYEIRKLEDKEFFEEYKKELKEFAERNRVKITGV